MSAAWGSRLRKDGLRRDFRVCVVFVFMGMHEVVHPSSTPFLCLCYLMHKKLAALALATLKRPLGGIQPLTGQSHLCFGNLFLGGQSLHALDCLLQ